MIDRCRASHHSHPQACTESSTIATPQPFSVCGNTHVCGPRWTVLRDLREGHDTVARDFHPVFIGN
jgi:hypothetical protein